MSKRLDLGCGQTRRVKGYIGVDKVPEYADVCTDIEKCREIYRKTSF